VRSQGLWRASNPKGVAEAQDPGRSGAGGSRSDGRPRWLLST
jgi:hypothetical protein